MLLLVEEIKTNVVTVSRIFDREQRNSDAVKQQPVYNPEQGPPAGEARVEPPPSNTADAAAAAAAVVAAAAAANVHRGRPEDQLRQLAQEAVRGVWILPRLVAEGWRTCWIELDRPWEGWTCPSKGHTHVRVLTAADGNFLLILLAVKWPRTKAGDADCDEKLSAYLARKNAEGPKDGPRAEWRWNRGVTLQTTLVAGADQQQLFNLLSPLSNEYWRAQTQEFEGLWKDSESECCLAI